MDLPDRIDQQYLQKWYPFWEKKGYFHSEPDYREPFTIVIPPPNVTGNLHMGHALNNTFQDVLARYKRMQGRNVLWVPGTDHGGIATQNVVERMLAKEGKTKEDVGRDRFLEIVQEWKESKRETIIRQLKALGCSCDWEREEFTMSDKLSTWVKKAFVTLFHKGLIYRGNYIINWCPRCQTALSDDEVDHLDQKGGLYYIKYKLVTDDRYLIVATTRPETILGDTAVAFNPDDDRYSELDGKFVRIPIIDREVPLIPDNYVKPEFGTGLVKITPAHDKNDYEIGKRHALPSLKVVNETGKIFGTGTKYDGMDRFECREKIIIDLQNLGLIEKIEDYDNTIGTCYRCRTIIEPNLSDQWFVKMDEMKEDALMSVNTNIIKMIPEKHKKIFNNWLNAKVDWCISRQIWWGHQIPIWYCRECQAINCAEDIPKQCHKCQSNNLEQDPDVLDTWFSSSLWAFSVFNEDDLAYYFPTSVLITGGDILFFWVARMIMSSYKLMECPPFHTVYLHGIVRDGKGEKMSKTVGNVIDPLEIIEEFGADVLRFTMMMLTPMDQDVNISKDSFKVGRAFCTKYWNSVRYILMNVKEPIKPLDLDTLNCADKWIFNKFNKLISDVDNNLDKMNFMVAAQELYNFTWNDFCNCYLKYAKMSIDTDRTKSVLVHIVDGITRLLHPFIPFCTEEIWAQLEKIRPSETESVMMSSLPVPVNIGRYDEMYDYYFDQIQKIMKKIRSVKSNFMIKSNNMKVVLICEEDGLMYYLRENSRTIVQFTRIGKISYLLDKDNRYLQYDLDKVILYCEIDNEFTFDNMIRTLQNKHKKALDKIKSIKKRIKNVTSSKKLDKLQININNLCKEAEEVNKEIEYYQAIIT